MALPPIDYSARDFASLYEALKAYVRARYPQWTDFAIANVGNVLLEAVAYVGDQLHYYMDRQAGEAFLSTVTQRSNMIKILKRLGYKMAGPQAALVDLQFTLAAPAAGDVVIPAKTQVLTVGPEPLVFETQAELIIPAGATQGTVQAKHAETRVEEFVGDGSPNQRLRLSFGPYLDGSARVEVNGEPWAEAEGFIGTDSTSKIFLVEVDENDQATILFGDGTNGAIPTGNIKVTYETGGGAKGNVPAGQITLLPATFTDSLGNIVSISVTNPLAATGGADKEDMEVARYRAPQEARSREVSITVDDIQANAESVAGVARALCRLTWQDSSIPDNTARVYIVPEGGGLPSQALKDAVIQELTQNKPMPPTMGLEVVDPLYKVVDIVGTIYVLPTADKAAIEAQKQAVLADLFSYTKRDENNAYVVDFGKTLYLSTIIAALRNIPGVYNVVLTAPTGDVVPAAAEIVALGDTSGLVVVQP